MGGPEQKIEEYLKDSVIAAGGACYKIKASGVRGVPDRIVIMNGLTVFVETKSKAGKISVHQRKVFNEIAKSGGFVFVLESKSRVDDFMLFMLQDDDDVEESAIILPEYMTKRLDS